MTNPSIGILVSRFNTNITSALLDGAVLTLKARGLTDAQIHIQWVPGAFELPFAAQRMARSGLSLDAIICLGAVIRGDTPHFEFVSAQCAAGIMQVGLSEHLPVIFGVITTDTIGQALERAGLKVAEGGVSKAHLQANPDPAGNKGIEAALTALEMVG